MILSSAIFTEDFRGISQSLQAITGICPQIGPGSLSSTFFIFSLHYSIFYSTVYNLQTKSLKKQQTDKCKM